jgi:hypothetical protein
LSERKRTMTGSEGFNATQIIMDWADRSKITWVEAAEELKRKGMPGIDQAVEELKRRSKALIDVPNAVLGDRDRVNWYMGPSSDGRWAAYWRALEEAGPRVWRDLTRRPPTSFVFSRIHVAKVIDARAWWWAMSNPVRLGILRASSPRLRMPGTD